MSRQQFDFEDSIIRLEVSHRGGGVEIDLAKFGYNGKMTAYQNYLGGGMLGGICSDCDIKRWQMVNELQAIALELRKWFHQQTVHDDEWEYATYEENQRRDISAY